MPRLLGINSWQTVITIIPTVMDEAIFDLFHPSEELVGISILSVGTLFCCNYYKLQKYSDGLKTQTDESMQTLLITNMTGEFVCNQ